MGMLCFIIRVILVICNKIPPRLCQMANRTMYFGHVEYSKDVPDPEECCKVCRMKKFCTFWRWNKLNKACDLLHDMTSTEINNMFVSGYRTDANGYKCIETYYIAYHGHNIMPPHRNIKSQGGCCKECSIQPDCLYWTFRYSFSRNPGCWLKNSSLGAKRDKESISGQSMVTLPPVRLPTNNFTNRTHIIPRSHKKSVTLEIAIISCTTFFVLIFIIAIIYYYRKRSNHLAEHLISVKSSIDTVDMRERPSCET